VNVHIIAHTHDDVGWLKTVDQYYYGTKKSNSPVSVEFILDSLIPELVMDRDKRFVYVEMSFFTKWWREQNEQMRSVVRRLVDEGRLEFINGGWCMNDEATVNYLSTIEQMTLGLKFLNETFGQCAHPKVGWQIDPFGHSNEQASLFAQFGFDGMYFTRISYLDKQRRTDTKSLDLIWHGDKALPGQTGSIYTNVFRDNYDAPAGYCFDVFCKDDLIVDNKQSFEYNLDERGQHLIDYIRKYANNKLTNQVLIPFGGDFQYSAAGQNFKSIDKLLKYIGETAPDINVFYSTPSCYQMALYNEVFQKDLKLPEKYDDFMPYDSSSTVWWSGYFTSKPSVKLYEREVANLLQVARLVSLENLIEVGRRERDSNQKPQLVEAKVRAATMKQLADHELQCLAPLWEVLGDLQHHDAITGTEKEQVNRDYVRRAYLASKNCAKLMGNIKREKYSDSLNRTAPLYEQLTISGRKYNLDPVFLEETSFCSLNISQCEPLEVPIDACHYSAILNHANQRSAHDHVKFFEMCSHRSPPLHRLSSMKRNKSLPKELERKGVLVTAYNPLVSRAKNVDIRLPCIGRCDLKKIHVHHLGSKEKLKLKRVPLPAGVESLPFRNSLTKYEVLFYGNIPPLGSASFLVSDTNEDDLIDEELNSGIETIDVIRSKRAALDAAPSDDQLEDCDYCELSMRGKRFFEAEMLGGLGGSSGIEQSASRLRRHYEQGSSNEGGGIGSDRVVVKFDMQSGMIVGLRRVSDGSFINITQKFGTYSPSDYGHRPGAYIFRPDSLEPKLMERPITFTMVKRNNGSLIEVHQKWADWIWQTIRVDGKKNYIEFDYVVGPVPYSNYAGHEVVTRYITSMKNQGIFFTDSNGRQMVPRTKLHTSTPEQLGGSFYPVVSSMMLKSVAGQQPQISSNLSTSAEAVAILVDRPQGGTSLNEGNMEFLIHRRHLYDDDFGVGEPLDEPGEDGRGLVTRGRHRFFLKFPPTVHVEERQIQEFSPAQNAPRSSLIKLPSSPRANVTYEVFAAAARANLTDSIKSVSRQLASEQDVYIVQDQVLNELKQESVKYALKPVLTFDRLRVSGQELLEILENDALADTSLLNTSLPHNIHLLTMQPWSRGSNELLLRFENLDNPMVLTQFPNRSAYKKLLAAYRTLTGAATPPLSATNGDASTRSSSNNSKHQKSELCQTISKLDKTRFDVEYLFKGIRIVSLEEYNLGANVRLDEDKRLDWTREETDTCADSTESDRPTAIRLSPRQIRTFLASYELVP